MSNPEVVSNLMKIFSRYDILLVQEVKDSTHEAFNQLLNSMKAVDPVWAYISNKPLGRSTHKEQ